MEVLWAVPEPVTAREVVDALPGRSLAYTTVLTVLSRLEKKALVRRARAAGRAYAYSPVGSREDHTAELMRAALDAAGDRVAALARFVGSVTPQEAEVLRRALESVDSERAAGAATAD